MLGEEFFGFIAGPELIVGPAVFPGVADGTDFCVVFGQVDDELGDAGFELADEVAIADATLGVVFARDTGDEAVEHGKALALLFAEHVEGNGVALELGFAYLEWLGKHAGDAIFFGEASIDVKEIGTGVESAHVGVEVGEFEAVGSGPFDLGAQLDFNFSRAGIGC